MVSAQVCAFQTYSVEQQISTSYWEIGRLTYNTRSNCLGNVGTVIGMFRTAV